MRRRFETNINESAKDVECLKFYEGQNDMSLISIYLILKF